MKVKKVVVVGAGIGGLATAIQLARHGLRVSLYEKNALPGGRCQQIIKAGHAFDSGPTMFIFPKLYRQFFKNIGEDLSKYVKLILSDPIYTLHFPDSSELNLSPKYHLMRQQLNALEPGSYTQYLRYLQLGKRHYHLITHILKYSFASALDCFRVDPFALLFSSALNNHTAVVKRYFHHPHLQLAFTFQDSYLSLSPFKAQAIYSAFPYTELAHGNFLPQGGMYQIILALVKIAKKYPITIHYQQSVKRIDVKGNFATGITLENNRHVSADYVITNAEVPYAYSNLLPPNSYARALTHLPQSCSAIVFHWGVDKVYSKFSTHNLFFSTSFKAGFSSVLETPHPPAEPHFYVQAPCRTDPARAPHHHDTLTVIVPINHIDPLHPVDWQAYRDRIRRYIFSRLNKAGIKNIQAHIKFEINYLPTDWSSHLNLPFGSIYGLHHSLYLLGPFRPKHRHAHFRNLFFVGASTHPGSGLPTVLISSQFVSQAIIQNCQPD